MNGPFSMAMLNNQRVYINKYPIVSPLKKLRRHPFFWLAKSTQLAFPATYLSPTLLKEFSRVTGK
jgi:hypothetical protein